MSCEKYQEQFPAYIKKELGGENRIRIKNHLKDCIECREIYFAQVKLNYIIDREEIFDSLPETSVNFNHEVLEQINRSSDIKSQKNTKLIWYAAAATLLIGITIGRFILPDENNERYQSQIESESLGQLIASENWGKLEIVLSDKDEFSRYSTDSIPIHVLLEKLITLNKMGVESLPLANTSDKIKTEGATSVQGEPQIQISLNDFIRILEQAKLQRSRITLEEVSNLLTKI